MGEKVDVSAFSFFFLGVVNKRFIFLLSPDVGQKDLPASALITQPYFYCAREDTFYNTPLSSF